MRVVDLYYYEHEKRRYGEKVIEEWIIREPEREENELLRISRVGKKYYVIYAVVPWSIEFEPEYEILVFDSLEELETSEKVKDLRKMFYEWGEKIR